MRTTSGVCVYAVIVAVAACERTPEYDQPQDVYNETAGDRGATGTAGTATRGMLRVADIVANPNSYVGQTVTVEADVEEVFGPRAFALDEDAPFAGGVDRDLLVLGKQTSDLARIDDQWLNNKVRVTGSVGRFSVVEVERELSWDLDPQIEAELERAGAVLFAESVSRVER